MDLGPGLGMVDAENRNGDALPMDDFPRWL
jgi:hypothetical protein